MRCSTLCPALFGFVFLGAVRAAAWAPLKDKSEHCSEPLNTAVASEDEASLLQAGTTNLHPTIDHGHYAAAKDDTYAKDEHKKDDTDTKAKYREDRHDEASHSAYASAYGKEENHKYSYRDSQSTHYDTDYHGKNHDYAHSVAKDSHYDRYQKSDNAGGDHGKSQDDVYVQGKDNIDDRYAKATYDEDQRYQKSDCDDGDNGKSQDDAYAPGKDKADDGYAKDKYGEDQHDKARVYGYAKEEKDKYTYRHAKSTQYDSKYSAKHSHYAHSTTKDSYADHYKNSGRGDGDCGKVGDEEYTQDTKHKYSNYDEKGNYASKYNMYDDASDKHQSDSGEGRSDGDKYYSYTRFGDDAYAKKRSDDYHNNYKEGEDDGDNLGKSRDYYRDTKYGADYSGMTGYRSSARDEIVRHDDYLGENEYNEDYYSKPHKSSYGKKKEDDHEVYYREKVADHGKYIDDHYGKTDYTAHAKEKNDQHDVYYGNDKYDDGYYSNLHDGKNDKYDDGYYSNLHDDKNHKSDDGSTERKSIPKQII